MAELLLALGVVLLVAGAVGYQRHRAVRMTHDRLEQDLSWEQVRAPVVGASNYRGTLWAGGVFALAWLAIAYGQDVLHWYLPPAMAFVAGTITWSIWSSVAAQKTLKAEQQLADALDLMVAGLLSGASIVEALESAGRETRQPLGDLLLEGTGRLRLGARPAEVLDEFTQRVPTDSMRLFTQVLKVQWQVGGALTPAIAAVARTIRDRIQTTRRVRSQSAEVRFSVIAILGVVYGIAALAWVNNSDKVQAFLQSEIGGAIAALTVVLQGIGLVWIARLSKVNAH